MDYAHVVHVRHHGGLSKMKGFQMLKKCTVVIVAGLFALSVSGCANFATNVHAFSTNYQSVVADVNADIAATAPDVAIACGNLQTAAVLIAPFLPAASAGSKSQLAQAAFGAANAAIIAYCQSVPTNIAQVLAQAQAAASAAKAAYTQIKGS
jgi:hypothetical protein